MKIIVHAFLVILLTILTASAEVEKQDPWERVVFVSFASSLITSMDAFEEWAEIWEKSERKFESKDYIIGSMLEVQMVAASKFLRVHPNPELLKRCLFFLGRNIPKDFEDYWAFVFLELPDVDRKIALEVNSALKKEGLRTFKERLNDIEIRKKKENRRRVEPQISQPTPRMLGETAGDP